MLDSLVAWLAVISQSVSLDELTEALADYLDSPETWDVEVIVSAELAKAPGDHCDLDGRALMLVHPQLTEPLVSPAHRINSEPKKTFIIESAIGGAPSNRSLRTNIDYIFTMRENIRMNREKLFKYYFGQFSKFDEFDKVMNACTQDYKALVLDGTVSSTIPTDSVMWYKARIDVPEFRLCKPVFWAFSKRFEMSTEKIREAQTRQFEIENVATDMQCSIRKNVAVIVQTEDEDGNVLSTQ